jgi:hypothetical protein
MDNLEKKYYNISYSENADWPNRTDMELCESCLTGWCEENFPKIIVMYRILDPIGV